MAQGNQFGTSKSNPGTSQLDARGQKIFEIYSSGKGYNGQAPVSSHIGSNVSTGSGGQSNIPS
jgi:hypothetical protein